MMIVSFPESKDIAKRIARKLKAGYSNLFIRDFPDGESYLKFTSPLRNKKVVFFLSLNDPDKKLVKLLLAAHTAKDLGAKSISLVAPYMCYMRQDKRFHAGECVSSDVIAKIFRIFDEIITVDPHLHRIPTLDNLFKNTKTLKLTAGKLIAEYIAENITNPVIIGPDSESYQWAEEIAKQDNTHAIILKKKRYTSRDVRIKMHGIDSLKKNSVVIVDDIISTGHTMIETVKEAKRLGATDITCICVHPIFAENAHKKLRKAGAKVISTNTINHPTNKIDISGLLAKALK